MVEPTSNAPVSASVPMAAPTPVSSKIFAAAPVMADPFTTGRRDLLDSLSDEFLHNYRKGRTLLAVDGASSAGTAQFADALATRLGRGGHGAFRASIDKFHRPRDARSGRSDDSADDFYRDSFDYDLFRRVLVEPFRMGGSTGFVTSAFDAERNIPIEMDWKTGPMDATLIVDGLFLNRPELRGLWSFSIWLDDSHAPSEPRRSAHDAPEESHELYVSEAAPRQRATAIVENSNPEAPRRIFADSC